MFPDTAFLRKYLPQILWGPVIEVFLEEQVEINQLIWNNFFRLIIHLWA